MSHELYFLCSSLDFYPSDLGNVRIQVPCIFLTYVGSSNIYHSISMHFLKSYFNVYQSVTKVVQKQSMKLSEVYIQHLPGKAVIPTNFQVIACWVRKNTQNMQRLSEHLLTKLLPSYQTLFFKLLAFMFFKIFGLIKFFKLSNPSCYFPLHHPEDN